MVDVPVIITSVVPKEFLYPALLWLIIPAALLLLWMTRRSFVREDPRFDDVHSARRRSKLRWIVFVLRALTVICLIAVLATPLTTQTTIRAGDVKLTILVDNSTSMESLDTSELAPLIQKLRQQVPVTVREISSGERSDLGDALLANMKPSENVLLVTDGYVTSGQSLQNALSYAAQTNSTVSALALESRVDDAAITIEAPLKAIADTNATIAVRITSTHGKPVPVTITIDGEVVFDERTAQQRIPFTKQFTAGKHQITATITEEDAVLANNRYDVLLTAVNKPRVLVVSQKSTALEALLSELYTVTSVRTVPRTAAELEPYYAVVLVDLPASAITPATSALSAYLYEGNGLFVVGGPNSYDYGGYKNAAFENMLPVSVGSSKGNRGVTNIVVSLDLSSAIEGSYVRQEDGSLQYVKSDRPALVRALGISVLDDIDANHNVGAVVIGSSAEDTTQNIVDNQYIFWDYIGGRALGRVSPLGPKRDQLTEAISTIRGGGQASSQYWLAAPLSAMEGVSGSKNIIVITDGLSCKSNCLAANGGSDEEQTVNIARTIAAQGGRVYTVGVVSGLNDEFLTRVATAGNGIYFKASERNKLRILFGDPDGNNDQDADAFGLVVLNSNHFITRDVNLQSTIFGYNEVTPKQYASMLVTAQNGQPVVTVWNYGVGRVASLTGYNGDGYGDLTAKGNSLLISRSGNWLVGDPERKQETVVEVPQLRVGERGTIAVTSTQIPVNDVLVFAPSSRETDRYEAPFTPSEQGFGVVGGIEYAASYPAEYERVGQDPALGASLAIANGEMLEPSDVDGIIEHVRTVRQLQETRKQPLRAPFLLAAAILFLLDITVRRLFEFTRKR
jgi:hypothetical protein